MRTASGAAAGAGRTAAAPPPQPPRRICIVGISGSGKTTLARRLAAELGWRHVDLDKIRYPTGAPETPPARLEAEAAAMARGPAWIAEGSYTQQMGALLAAADQIIWLDMGPRQAAYRVVRRHVIHRLQRRPRFPTSTLRLARNSLLSRRAIGAGRFSRAGAAGMPSWRREIELELEPYAAKVWRIRSVRQARRLHYAAR